MVIEERLINDHGAYTLNDTISVNISNDTDNHTGCYHNLYNYQQYIIIVYVGSPIAVIGIFANLLLAFLFGRRKNCGTTNVYFSILAFLDIAICSLYILLFSFDALALYHDSYPMWKLWMSYVLPFFALSRIIQLTSTYIVVTATIERFFIVGNFKLISRSFCTPVRRQFSIICLIILCTTIRLPSFWDYKLGYHSECDEYDKFSTIEIEPYLMGYSFYREVYNFYIIHVIQIFIPFTILVVLNASIVYQLRKQLSLAKRFVWLFPEKCVSQQVLETGLSKDKVRKATYTLVFIVTSYLVCNCVHLLLSILEHVAKVPYLDDESGAPTSLYNYLTDAVSLLFMFNSSIRLFIHMASNELLRKEMINFCGLCVRRKNLSSVHRANGFSFERNSRFLNTTVSYPLIIQKDIIDGDACNETLL